ncbi:MAG: GntR family transcriptional regulator [Synergistaceae bacterium]|jgi:DNA-binding GntR family transcriptional regulator|nr:GntR family transcriptional regulator [Synergistaceae bacterium]
MREQRSIETLREKVYNHLKKLIKARRLKSGEFMDLNMIGQELGMSRTPLRDALFQLESEGFITIFPRRGVMLNSLDLKMVRDIYEIIGALESSALLSVAGKLSANDIKKMKQLDDEIQVCLDKDNYEALYKCNVAFHNVFLNKSKNDELIRTARIQRERLYDFPEWRTLLTDWEQSNLYEHIEIVRLLEEGDFTGAADYLRDVHWSYSVQEKFIRTYYLTRKSD